jgi:peptidyl-prolyl cis-trans isomerase D
MVLQRLHGKASSWVIKILLSLIILSFGLWGINGLVQRNSRADTVATVGEIPLSRHYLLQRVRSLLQQTNGSITLEEALKLGLARQVLDSLINQVLVDLEIKDLKLTISTKSIQRYIQNDPAFQDDPGHFSVQKFSQFLKNAGLTERRFIEEIQNSMLQTQLMAALSTSSFVPALLSTALYQASFEKRDVTLVTIPAKDMKLSVKADQTALENYYESHKNAFTKPEYRKISLVIIDPSKGESLPQLTEENFKQAYEEHIQEFSTPEKRQLLIYSFDTLKAAQEAQASLSQGQALESGVDLGFVTQDTLTPEISHAAFSLEKGKASDPVSSGEAFEVLFVKDIMPSKAASLEQVKDKLRQMLLQEASYKYITSLVHKLEDHFAEGGSLEEAAKVHNLNLFSIEHVTKEGLNSAGKKVLPKEVSSEMLKAAYAQEEIGESTILESEDGKTYVLRVDEVRPSQAQPFADIKEGVQKMWEQEQKQNQALVMAKAMQKDLESGKSLQQVTASFGHFPTQTVQGLTRQKTNQKADLSAEMLKAIFSQPQGKVAVGLNDQGAVVGIIQNIETPALSTSPDKYNHFKERIDVALTQDVQAQFIHSLREKFGVEINEDMLKKIETSGE